MTLIAHITVDNRYFSKVEKQRDGSYKRTTQHYGPGSKRHVERISELEAAKLAAFSDWTVCQKLIQAKRAEYPYQAILAELQS